MTSLLRQFDPATKVGRPIRVQQCDKPTLDEVVRIQGQYIEELMRYASKNVYGNLTDSGLGRIWNTYKDEFARKRVKEMEFIA